MQLLHRISLYLRQNKVVTEHREQDNIIRTMVEKDTSSWARVILDQERVSIIILIIATAAWIELSFALEQGYLLHGQGHLLREDNCLIFALRIVEEVPLVTRLNVVRAASDSQATISDAHSYETWVSYLCLDHLLNFLMRGEIDDLKCLTLTLQRELEEI